MDDGQLITKKTYEDPVIVEEYIKRNALQPMLGEIIKSFSKTIKGKDVLDLGCGPGHDSYLFAGLGFNVTGLDYSHEMIRRAKKFKKVANPPHFMVGNMRNLTDYFTPNSFDAIWAAASLLHIPKGMVPQVLEGITTIARNGAKVFVHLKGGSGTKLIRDDMLGKTMQREFIFWTKDCFLKETAVYNWKLDDFFILGGSAVWPTFFFTVEKNG